MAKDTFIKLPLQNAGLIKNSCYSGPKRPAVTAIQKLLSFVDGLLDDIKELAVLFM